MDECQAYCIAKRFDFERLVEAYCARYRALRYGNILSVECASGVLLVFDYGVLVSWGLGGQDVARFRDELLEYAIEPLAEPVIDEFTYSVVPDGMLHIHNDHIRLDSDEPMVKLALSHGIAQSVKLAQFEEQTTRTIADMVPIPERIARTGRSNLGRREISRMRGRLFLAKNDIILNFDLLDVPEFFWEYPEVDPYYEKMARYLEHKQRIEVLSKRLETIHELFEMLADEQKHQHSSLLEWIIIWLIAIEILIFLFHDIWGWV